MTVGIDACLLESDNSTYDIQLGSDGDILTQDFFDTAIIVSLFTERRANESEVLDPALRRGWVGNESTPGFEQGSKIWLFEQARITRSVLNGLSTAVKDALEWFVDSGFADSIDAVEVTATTTGITLSTNIRRPNSQVDRQFFTLWDNTAISCPGGSL